MRLTDHRIRFIYCLLFLFGAAAPPLVLAKSSEWQEFTSQHFTVYSDRKTAEAKALLQDFERFRTAALAITGLPSSDEIQHPQIFLFRRQRDYRGFEPDPKTAGSFRDTWLGPRMLVGAEAKLADTSLVLFHEYVHHLMRERSQLRYPLWYDEGFADLLAASVVSARHVEIGQVHPWRQQDLERDGPLPINSLLSPDKTGDNRYWSRYYASAWLLMHFLQLGPSNGESDYRAGMASYLLAVHQGADLAVAFEQHFGVTPAVLDARLKAYMEKKSLLAYRLEVKPYNGPLRDRRLSINEAAQLLGDLAYRSGQQTTALEWLQKVDAREATVARPFSLRAVIEQHQGRGDFAQHILGLALQRHGNDAYVLTNAAHLHWDKGRLEPAGSQARINQLDKVAEFAGQALRLDAGNLEAGHYLAQAEREKGELEQAIQVLSGLYRQHPTDVRLNLELGELLSQSSHPGRALPYLERVIAWEHNHTRRLRAQALLRSLGLMQKIIGGDPDQEHLTPVQIQPR
jgi:Flp pilus assembly protein TadD